MEEFQQEAKAWCLSGIDLLSTAAMAGKKSGLEPLGVLSLLGSLGLGAGTGQPCSRQSRLLLRPAAVEFSSGQVKDSYCSFSKPGRGKAFSLGRGN